MLNLFEDIIKHYLKLPISVTWFVEFKHPIEVMNLHTYGKPPVKLELISFGPGSARINAPKMKNQIVPCSELSFGKKDTIKIIMNMEIIEY